jgi:hypothetical protein
LATGRGKATLSQWLFCFSQWLFCYGAVVDEEVVMKEDEDAWQAT